MHFSVTFEAPEHILGDIGRPGIDLLDLIREQHPEARNLPAKDIGILLDCTLTGNRAIRSDYTIYITEEEARQTGLFSGCDNVKVLIPEGFLSTFIKTTCQQRYKNKKYTPELKILGITLIKEELILEEPYVNVKFNIDEQSIFEAWKEAGYPLDWREYLKDKE